MAPYFFIKVIHTNQGVFPNFCRIFGDIQIGVPLQGQLKGYFPKGKEISQINIYPGRKSQMQVPSGRRMESTRSHLIYHACKGSRFSKNFSEVQIQLHMQQRNNDFWKISKRPNFQGVTSPLGVLRVPSLFHIGNNFCKFSARSEKLSRTTFLKQKDSRKQELALGILLIGYFHKSCQNDIKTL